jgi:hypothetical protein
VVLAERALQVTTVWLLLGSAMMTLVTRVPQAEAQFLSPSASALAQLPNSRFSAAGTFNPNTGKYGPAH